MNPSDWFDLTGKRLFITGGSRGLGREMALAIAAAGADVVLSGRDETSLEETRNEIEQLRRKSDAVVGDIGDPAICESVCGEVVAKHGPSICSQRGRPPPRHSDRGTISRRLAEDHRSQPDEHLSLHQDLRRGNDPAGRGRSRHQHRIDFRDHREPGNRGAEL